MTPEQLYHSDEILKKIGKKHKQDRSAIAVEGEKPKTPKDEYNTIKALRLRRYCSG